MSGEGSPQSRYTSGFAGETAQDSSKRAKALALALDIRRFEIELYWKRAAYFWVFTGAAFAAYLSVLTEKSAQNQPKALLLISCLGLIFSAAWYFVNRGSKFWQLNWEAHVDLLEDSITGPIYKTVLKDESPLWKIAAPYSFSVTKINQLLSFLVFVVFIFLTGDTLHSHYTLTRSWRNWANWDPFPSICVPLTVLALLVLWWLGRTSRSDKDKNVAFDRRRKGVSRYETAFDEQPRTRT